MGKQLEIQKKLVLSLCESLDLLRQFIHHLYLHPLVEPWRPQCGHAPIHHPLFASFNYFSYPFSFRLPGGLVCVSLYSQFALLVAVTGIGGNFSGTGAGGGPRSPEAAHDPTPGGPHVDTGPSEEEAQDPSR